MQKRNYVQNVERLMPLDAESINGLQEDAYIYFGRETCPYCCDFVEEFPTISAPVHYVNTENTATDAVLQQVREQYDIKTVPSFVFRKKDGTFTKLNRDVRQRIADFIESSLDF